MNKKIRFGVLFALLGNLAAVATMPAQAAQNNMKIKGTLVNAPCVVLPENSKVEVDFGDIRLLDIYEPGFQFPNESFTLVLSDCDLTIAQKLKVKFSGTENLLLPGSLALTGSDLNPGLGIFIELTDGTPMKINQFSSLMPISKAGKNELQFNSFIKATSDVVNNKQVKVGKISATATFIFEYE
ncbi:fimbrial protein [Providencia rustigianii]|uniref:fimbrial protein n=1 Tax=Providencia rustigianii TaxID=158850 RepID=UPI000F714F38|nr:fimbrial protein [Providencia rustigianii]MTC59815.1 fimbrial protein [Providencia rustigianii]VEH53608.1 Fimbrial adapter papK precursor [Providencia rustigianii]